MREETQQFIEELLEGEDQDEYICYSEWWLQNSWEKFPAVGVALRNHLPDCKQQFCIATLRANGAWGVGVHDDGISRYHASRVALAIQLMNQLLDMVASRPTLEALVHKSRGMGASRRPRKKKNKRRHGV